MRAMQAARPLLAHAITGELDTLRTALDAGVRGGHQGSPGDVIPSS
jgi:hypothetical protein